MTEQDAPSGRVSETRATRAPGARSRTLLDGGGRVVAVLLLVVAGCSVVLDPSRTQCTIPSDCHSSSTESLVCSDGLCVSSSSLKAGTRYTCPSTDHPSYPFSQPVVLNAFNQAGPAPKPGNNAPLHAELSLCRRSDPTCEQPVDGPHRTDDTGRTTIVFTEPDLFLRFIPVGDDTNDYPPTRLFPAEAFRSIARAAGTTEATINFADNSITSALATLLNVKVDPTKGQLIVTALPCPGSDALGLGFATPLSSNATRYYVTTGFPDFTSEVTVRGPSYPQAVGGFVNVTPAVGPVALVDPATHTELMHVDADIVPGWSTYVVFDVTLGTGAK